MWVDGRNDRADDCERVEQYFKPTQDPPRGRPFLSPLHLLQVVDERGEVILQLYDPLRKQTGGPGDVVGEPRCVRVVIQPCEPQPELGRTFDPPRHHIREMGMATENLVGRVRTQARGFSQLSEIMSDLPLSLVRLPGADSVKPGPPF